MKTSRVKLICDTGVISRAYSNFENFKSIIEDLSIKYEICITTTIKIELYRWIYDYKSKVGLKTFNAILKSINSLPVIKLDRKVCDVAEKLTIKHHQSGVGDLLTAAVSIDKKVKLFTINYKDFKTIPRINLYLPPHFQ